MQQICRERPVRKQCLEHALTYEVRSPRPPQYGIFGGLTPTERREPGKRVYIAGPISGSEFFRIHFSCVALSLIFRGFEPVNPAAIDFGPDESKNASWEDYMRVCLPMLATCDYIFLLSGWEKSRGARLEKQIADALGIKEVPTSSK